MTEPNEPDNTQETPKQQEGKSGVSAIPIVIVLVIFVVFAGIFLFEMANLSEDEGGVPVEEVSADSYMDTVSRLLADADPANGQAVLAEYGCSTCHGNRARAPAYETTKDNAAERRAPMTAAAYVYESIIHPGAYRLEGYPNNMPRNYAETIPEDDLADMVAWLSQPTDSADENGATEASDSEATPEVTPEAEATEQMDAEEAYPLTDALIEEYEANAEALLADADPARGEELVAEYGCNACHAGGNAGVVGPGHAQVTEMAAERREPLSAAAYVYEAILYPDRHLVDGWADIMPNNYDERLSDDELGHIMAYLLQAEQD